MLTINVLALRVALGFIVEYSIVLEFKVPRELGDVRLVTESPSDDLVFEPIVLTSVDAKEVTSDTKAPTNSSIAPLSGALPRYH